MDIIPKKWEDRIFLYLANLVKLRRKSTTIKSYFSAIKATLWDVGYNIVDTELELHAITRACRHCNDKLHTRLPIRIDLLEVLLFEIERKLSNQNYLRIMFKALFALAYYGLFRIGELAQSEHSLRAKDVFIATNKRKILCYLYTSKTHAQESKPQKIRIAGIGERITSGNKLRLGDNRHFCLFTLVEEYMAIRGYGYTDINENFFILRGKLPLTQGFVRLTLAQLLKRIGLNHTLYSFQSMRVGRATNLYEWGLSIEQIKVIGRWKSNVVYKYLKL